MITSILIPDGTFEDGLIGNWTSASANLTAAIDSTVALNGGRSLRVTRLNTNGAWQVFSGTAGQAKAVTPVKPGETILSTLWARHDSTTAQSLFIRHRHYADTTLVSDVSATAVSVPPNVWFKLDHSATVPATANGMHMAVLSSTAPLVGQSMWIEDLVVWRNDRLWGVTSDDILNLNGVRRRLDSFRFELCDRDLRPIGELHPDRERSVPQIEVNTGSETVRRLSSLKLTPSEAAEVNTIRDRLRVYMRLQNGAEYRLGTFLWADASEPVRSWGNEQDSELVDLGYVLSQQSTRSYGWSRGGNIALIMFFLIFRAGFELADVAVIGNEASRGLAEPIAWEPGASWHQMLTDLGTLVGFAPPWFDRDGRLHLDVAPDPTVAPPTVTDYGPGTRVIADSVIYSSDILSAPNEFAAYDSGTGALRVGRFALPDSAPHSFANRGFHVGLVESVQGLANQAQANKAAHNLALSRSVALEWLTFASTADPRHDVYDIVPAFGKHWLEDSWNLQLRSGGQMQHTLRRPTYDLETSNA